LLHADVICLPSVIGEKPLFNFYRDIDLKHDQSDGAHIRRNNLYSWLENIRWPPRLFLVGEAPGWRGCRFSGVPFTSEAQFTSGELPFDGHASSQARQPYRESTATIFWKAISPAHLSFFSWNVVPLHPHLPGESLANRTPSRQEIVRFIPLLNKIHDLIQPSLVVAVGRSAEGGLSEAGIPHLRVRHPAHGGGLEFEIGLKAILTNLGFSGQDELQ
jgi:uracil-DNA glycosylase